MTQMMTEPEPTRSHPVPPSIPAGWYADPQGSRQRRWWNGSAWTHALEPLEPEAPAPVTPAAPWENLPGPSVRAASQNPGTYSATAQGAQPQQSPARNAPTVQRALAADTTTGSFPTRRQLREAEAEAARAAEFAASVGMGGTASGATGSSPVVPSSAPSAAPAASAEARPATAARPVEEQREPFAMGPAATTEAATAPALDRVDVAMTRPRSARPTVSADTAAAMLIGATPAGQDSPAGGARDFGSRGPLDRLGPITPSTTAPETPGRSYTPQTWLLVALPVVVLAAAWGLVTLAPEQYTLPVQAGLLALLLVGGIGLALQDRAGLASAGHERTASPLWALLTPLGYLIVRATITRRESGRGWAPAIALLLVGAAIAAAAYLTPLSLAPVLG